MIKLQHRNRLQKIFFRLQVAWAIVFHQKRGVALYLAKEDLLEIIKTGQLKPGTTIVWDSWGMPVCYAQQFIKSFAADIDETEVICNKAEWEAAAIEEIEKEKE